MTVMPQKLHSDQYGTQPIVLSTHGYNGLVLIPACIGGEAQ